MPISAHMTDSVSMLTLAQSYTLGEVFTPVVTNLLVGLFLLVSIAMILLVLIQRPQGGGLSGAFGSGGGGAGGAGQTAFGTKTGDVLTYATIGIFVCFLGFAIVLNFATRPQDQSFTEPVITAPTGAAPVDSETAGDEDSEESSEDTTDDASENAGDNEMDLSGTPDEIIETIDEALEDSADEAAQAVSNLPAADIPAVDD